MGCLIFTSCGNQDDPEPETTEPTVTTADSTTGVDKTIELAETTTEASPSSGTTSEPAGSTTESSPSTDTTSEPQTTTDPQGDIYPSGEGLNDKDGWTKLY